MRLLLLGFGDGAVVEELDAAQLEPLVQRGNLVVVQLEVGRSSSSSEMLTQPCSSPCSSSLRSESWLMPVICPSGRHLTRVDSQLVSSVSIWEIVFLMVILKIPIVYLCTVVYYAVKAEPKPEEPATVAVSLGGPQDSSPRRRRRPRRPHGGPARSYPRTARARAYAERR